VGNGAGLAVALGLMAVILACFLRRRHESVGQRDLAECDTLSIAPLDGDDPVAATAEAEQPASRLRKMLVISVESPYRHSR
jgi:hypothetical protein